MFEISSRSYRTLAGSIIYLTAIAGALTIATLHSRAGNSNTLETPPPVVAERSSSAKPFFSLYTNRTYSSSERARLWVDYNGVENLDFRVYQIKDPLKFFTQLNDPHQMGEQEEEQFQNSVQSSPSALERVRALKRWAYAGIKSYVRTQLQNDSRKSFNHKFRAEDEPTGRVPLNVADYARVPLLNPDQLVSRWREPLTPLQNQYDRRMIPLGKRDRGVYLVEAVSGDLRAYTVVVVTDLTMVEKSAPNGELLVYAVDRKTGEPRPGAQVQIVKQSKVIANGVTDNQGVLKTRIDDTLLNSSEMEADPVPEETGPRSFLILAHERDNFAISDLQSFYFRYESDEDETDIKSYIYTDRPVYRPNHKVYFKGILRAIDEHGNYRSINESTVSVTIEDPNKAQIFTKELPLSSHGTFRGEVELSEESPLGYYQIIATLKNGSSCNGSFEVAEYKKPEFKVKVSTPKAFVSADETTKFSINARYFFGSPVTNAEVKYYIYRSRYYVWGIGEESDDSLGEEGDSDDEYSDYYSYGNDMVQEGEGKLDATGKLDVEFKVPPIDENDPWDYSYSLDAQVTDSSRRTINGSTSLVGTRAKTVANAFPNRYVYHKGDIAKIEIKTTDYEGRPVSTKVQLKFIERTWTKVVRQTESGSYNDYEMREREVASKDLETDSQGKAIYNYPTSEAGNITIKTIINEDGKQIASIGGYLWVTEHGQAWTESDYYDSNYGSIKLVPDKKSYRPGETAHVLAILPTDKAHLLVSTELSTVLSAWQVNAPDRSIILDVPIQASYAPNIFLDVTYVKDGEMYTSNERLVVPARDKTLKLEIISNKQEYKPRETASYTILARDADGAPVSGAEVSLGVVDESIYSVSPDYSSNIRREFYGMRYSNVETHLAINYTFIGYAGDKPMELAKNKPTYQLADFKNEGEVVEPIIRKDFKDTAFWQPEVITGADGRATVKVRLPDNLTTWRATARGVTADTKVGETRYKVLARKDVILRLETPRFATQGDTVTLSGIVHNYLNTDKATQISLAIEGAQLLSPARQTVTIGKQGEHRIDWQIAAPNTGQVKLLAKALTNTESDAVELPLEVVPRGLRGVKNDTWSTGDENADRTFTLEAPANADARARKLRIEVTPSVAGTLFGALDYLTTYPYGCTEQTMSSFLPNVMVTEALKEVKSSSIRESNNLEKKVTRGRDRLYAFQHEDGGWGWWKDDQSDPFMTAYVIDGLTLAKRAGYEIDENRIARGRVKLEQMLAGGTTEAGTSIDLETRAFMIYALEETGGVENQYVDGLFLTRDKLQPYGRALLALTLKHRKDNDRAWLVANEIERSAGDDGKNIYWASRRQEMLDFAEWNDTEATALSLKALTRIKPDSALLPRTARWLVSNRRNGFYWSSTKDTAFAIFGLIDYLKMSRELSPDYDVEVYLNGETVLAQHVSSAGTSQTFVLSRKANEVSTANQVRVVKRGRGMLYFSASLDYHTDDEQVAARGSSNLSLTREYLRLRVEEKDYRLRWVVEPLTGEIHSGDLLVVKLHVTGAKARHLMIEDPIPAGAEQLKTIGSLNLDHTNHGWCDWSSSREFRDNRTVYFLDYFDGDATFQYVMRVQVPGEFRIAPARVELMYQPDTQANTASGRMAIRERK